MTEIAVVIWEDRHTDVEVYLFSVAAAAVFWARARAAEMNRHGDLEEHEGDALTHEMRRDGWIYDATYGESDHIRVQIRTLDKEIT